MKSLRTTLILSALTLVFAVSAMAGDCCKKAAADTKAGKACQKCIADACCKEASMKVAKDGKAKDCKKCSPAKEKKS